MKMLKEEKNSYMFGKNREAGRREGQLKENKQDTPNTHHELHLIVDKYYP